MKKLSSNNDLSKKTKNQSYPSMKIEVASPGKETSDSGKIRLGDGVAPPVFMKK
jgi:hypothetical protein